MKQLKDNFTQRQNALFLKSIATWNNSDRDDIPAQWSFLLFSRNTDENPRNPALFYVTRECLSLVTYD